MDGWRNIFCIFHLIPCRSSSVDGACINGGEEKINEVCTRSLMRQGSIVKGRSNVSCKENKTNENCSGITV